jgi:hypothetical protein
MSNLLLLLLLFAQGLPQRTGTVTGIVRSSNGSPSVGVRVYAITYRDAVEADKAPPALESLTQTDNAGRYKLDVPPGRYYIASGSVASPTYYPGSTDLSAAKIVTVGSDLTVSDINFGSFIPASRNPTGFSIVTALPPGNAVLTGILRYPDGKPAAGVALTAIPSSALPGGTTSLTNIAAGTIYLTLGRQLVGGGSSVPVTDSNGAYRIDRLGPETYYILAGYADAPTFYPGTPDQSKAKTVTTTATSTTNNLDFQIPLPPPTVAVRGKVVTSDGAPAVGAAIRLRSKNASSLPLGLIAPAALPVLNGPKQTIVANDGTFAFSDVLPGDFAVDVSYSGIGTQTQDLVVKNEPVNVAEVVIQVALLSGRIRLEDGSAVPNPKTFGEGIITTVRNPNMIASTIMPISAEGTFNRLVEGNEFRFYLRSLPEEYEIRSMKFKDVDLMKETFTVTGKESVNIEIRVAKKTASASPATTRVTGTVVDSATNNPIAVDRVTLCCSSTGPAERYSAPVRADGTFEFSGIPAGRYTPSLQPLPGAASLNTVNTPIDVEAQGTSKTTVFTTQQFGQVTARLVMADGSPVPDSVRPQVAFGIVNGHVKVVGERNTAGVYLALVPLAGEYDVTVTNLPTGYTVKSVSNPVRPVANTTANALLFGNAGTSQVTVTLERP